jgi:hypothetical protein
MAAIDSTASFQTFASTTGLLQSDLWKKDRTLDDFPRPTKELKVIRQGFMYRPATFTKWRPMYFVLTESGYLHCFEVPSGLRRAESKKSIKRSGSVATIIDDNINILEDSGISVYYRYIYYRVDM